MPLVLGGPYKGGYFGATGTSVIASGNLQAATLVEPTIIVAASGGDFTSINAAINDPGTGPGDVIEARAATPGGTFTDNTAITVTVSGTQADRIITRGRAGDLITLTGVGANSACMNFNGASWHDFGENIRVDGQIVGQGSLIQRGVWTNDSPDNIFRFRSHRLRNHCGLIREGNSPRCQFRTATTYLVGGLDDGVGGGDDYGDGIEFEVRAPDSMIYKVAGAAGGHGVSMTQSGIRVFYQFVRGENLWDQEDDARNPGVTTDGNRVGGFGEDSTDCVWQDCVWGPIGVPYGDNNTTQILRLGGQGHRIRRGLLFGSRANGACLTGAFGQADDTGIGDLYICHMVMDESDDMAINIAGANGISTLANTPGYNYGPFNIYNSIFLNTNGANVIDVMWASGRPSTDPDLNLSIRNCIFPVGGTIRLNDVNGGNQVLTVAQLNAMPLCGGNIEVAPAFVNPGWDDAAPYTKRRVIRDATYGVEEFNMTHITASYDDYEPTAAQALNGAAALTQVSTTVTASTITVDDPLWFHAGSVDADSTIPGDTINAGGSVAIITGISGNDLSLDRIISVTSGDDVFLGSSASPNIGWWQGAGFYT